MVNGERLGEPVGPAPVAGVLVNVEETLRLWLSPTATT